MSLAAQKFVSDIAHDALQHCKMRGSGQSSRKSGKVSAVVVYLCAATQMINIIITQLGPAYITFI